MSDFIPPDSNDPGQQGNQGWGQAPQPSPWGPPQSGGQVPPGQGQGGYGHDGPPQGGHWQQPVDDHAAPGPYGQPYDPYAPPDPYAHQGYQAPYQNYGIAYTRQSQAGMALGLSIVGFFCCGVLSIVGMIMGKQELNAIEQGTADPVNRGTAQAAFIIGLIVTILMVAGIAVYAVAIVAAGAGSL